MQIKKTGRDERYGDATNGYSDGETDEYEAPEFESALSRTRLQQPESDDVEMRTRRLESVIDANSKFDGKFESAQDVIIQGVISGEVVCHGMLTIERDARAKAKIQARDAQIRGRLEGDIVCSGRLIVSGTAHVTGTIKAATLVVEEGATISGTVDTSPAPVAQLRETKGAAARSEPDDDATAEGETIDETPAPAPATAKSNGNGNTRWRSREVPSFALVSSDTNNERAAN